MTNANTHNEHSLPLWAQTLLAQQRVKLDQLRREHDAMDSASTLMAEHEWFTLSGPFPDEATRHPQAKRTLWYLSEEGARCACELYPGDVLLVGRSTKRIPRHSSTMPPATQYQSAHYKVSTEALRMMQSGNGPLLFANVQADIISDAIQARQEADAMRRAVNKVYWYSKEVRRVVQDLRIAVSELRRVLRRMPEFETGADVEADAVFIRVLKASDQIVETHAQVPETVYR